MAELPNHIFIYKNEGETPLEALSRLRVEKPEFKDAVLTYAGRLDPMAEGVLLVLVNEENKNREQYLNLDKEYEVEVLFGVGTDTGDVLGKVLEFSSFETSGSLRSTRSFLLKTRSVGSPVANQSLLQEPDISQSEIQELLNTFAGHFTQSYPNYSSKTVNGKPLFQWVREGRLSEIEIPTKQVEIYSIEQIGESRMMGKEVLEQVENRIAKVNGDFRQQEILESWREELKEKMEQEFHLIKIKVSCSSGTYMRTLAENIGNSIGVSALAWRIIRTKVVI
jgi:tRNA pseudouridine(55) synthase